MVAKEKGRILFFQYSPNLLDFPRLFYNIQNLLLLCWFWWQFLLQSAFLGLQFFLFQLFWHPLSGCWSADVQSLGALWDVPARIFWKPRFNTCLQSWCAVSVDMGAVCRKSCHFVHLLCFVFLIITRLFQNVQLFSSYFPCKITEIYWKITDSFSKTLARWYISTPEHSKPPENRKIGAWKPFSLITAPKVPCRQQKGRQREPMGGFLRAVCLASVGSRSRL